MVVGERRGGGLLPTDMVVDDSLIRQTTKIFSLCACWYTFSAANNVLGKEILATFPHPITLPMMQLVACVCLLGPLVTLNVLPEVAPAPILSGGFYLKSLLPLGLGKLLAKMAGYISLGKVPVSYTHTVKALMPFFTVLLSLVVFKETYTLKVYLSLVPIIVGVLLASMTEIGFNASGMVWAVISTFFSALINVWAKKCMRDVHIHHVRLLLLISQIGCIVLFPLWMYIDVWDVTTKQESVPNLAWLLLALPVSGLLDFGQSLAAFWMISLLSPLSYSVANATKRIAIIVVSLLILKNPVTFSNLFWMMTAVGGVAVYNKVKYDSCKPTSILPVSHSLGSVSEICNDHSAVDGSRGNGCCHRTELDKVKLPLKII